MTNSNRLPLIRKRLPFLILLVLTGPAPAADATAAALRKALTLHASFDQGAGADFARGDRSIYTASSYKNREDARPGLHHPDVSIVAGQGRHGGALQFRKKNTKAIYYRAENNVAYRKQEWSGTVSFWLSLDPDQDLEPGFCDPIQVTAESYNDAALWVDFTRDERPRHFRLGVFGDLKVWNPGNIPSDKNPDFQRRLITVTKHPFGRGRWTHVAITHAGFNSSGEGGVARLYLNGVLQGKTEGIREPFSWDLSRAAIRLGVNYVGLFDELAVFDRALSDPEVQTLYQLKAGAGSLQR